MAEPNPTVALLAETRVTVLEADRDTVRKAHCLAKTELLLYTTVLPILGVIAVGTAISIEAMASGARINFSSCDAFSTNWCLYSDSLACMDLQDTFSYGSGPGEKFIGWLIPMIIVHFGEILTILSAVFGFISALLLGADLCSLQMIYSMMCVRMAIQSLVRTRSFVLMWRLGVCIFAVFVIASMQNPITNVPGSCLCDVINVGSTSTCPNQYSTLVSPIQFAQTRSEMAQAILHLKNIYGAILVIGVVFIAVARCHYSMMKNVSLDVETRIYQLADGPPGSNQSNTEETEGVAGTQPVAEGPSMG